MRDEKYDAWGQDQRISEEERAYWEEMTPGADEYHTNYGRTLPVPTCKTCGGTQRHPMDVAINFSIHSRGTPEIGLCNDPFHGVPFEAGMMDSVCTACGRDLAAQECCVACGDDQ